MGHLINPISYRLYNLRYWNNNWFSSFNYSFFVNQDILIQLLFRKLVYSLGLDKNGLIFSNLKIIRSFSKLYLYLYIHDSVLDILMVDLKKNGNYPAVKKHFQRKCFLRVEENLNKLSKPYSTWVFKKLKYNYLPNFIKNLIYLYFYQRLLKTYWNLIKNIFFYNLKKLNLNKFFNHKLYVLNLSKSNVSASIISEFFFIRLKQYYTTWEILKNISVLFRKLQNYQIISGYKITLSGRFTRKQRATYSWKNIGSIATSTMKSKLDFKFSTIALKYSSCTVKVWLRLNKTNPLIDFVI